MNYNELYSQICAKKSFLCVGLDSDTKLLPESLKGEQYPVFKFNQEIVDATAEYTVAYKPNTAFYEAFGTAGWEQFEMTVDYIKSRYPEIMVIADAKRGDIGNTAKRYAQAFYEQNRCDAVTLAPYMGRDSVQPFLDYEDKWAIVLALTSNPSAVDFEMGNDLYKKVITTVMSWGSIDNTMFVVGATRPEMLADIRQICPDHFLLVPGVGAQGGTVADVAKYGLNDHCGLLVNSSRGIIFKSKEADFADAAAKAAKELRDEMALVLK
jgi:orotidine-5'-phosphate decarboxylase